MTYHNEELRSRSAHEFLCFQLFFGLSVLKESLLAGDFKQSVVMRVCRVTLTYTNGDLIAHVPCQVSTIDCPIKKE